MLRNFTRACMILLTAAVTAAAQTPRAMTLHDAVELGLKQNLEIQIAHIRTALGEQTRVEARSALLPSVSMETSEAITRFNLKAQIGVQIPDVPHSIGPYQAIHSGVVFGGPVLDLALLRNYQASGHALAGTRADEQTVREETVLLIVNTYMRHLRALASLKAAESRVQLAERLEKQAEDLLAQGVASRIDVSRAQVRLTEEQQIQVDARREIDTSLFALQRVLSLPGSDPLEFRDAEKFFATPSPHFPTDVDSALADRSELRSAAENVKSAHALYGAALSASLPAVRFEGRWNEQGPTLNTLTPGYEYMVDVRVPLFTSGRLTAQRRAAALEEQRARATEAQERDRVTEQVRDGQAELAAASHAVLLSRDQVRLASQEVSLSEGRFVSGVTDNIEVTTAQDALARANDAEIGALYRYNLARAELARASGGIEQIYTRP